MKKLKHSVLFFLAFAILFPSGVGFAHVFSVHEHEVCQDHKNGHLHQSDPDCEYFQFRHLQNFYSTPEVFSIFVFTEISDNKDYFYTFFPPEETSLFLLRGPPGRYEA